MRILVGDIGGQAVDLALQAFDALHIGNMSGGQAADDLQDAAVLFAEVVVEQGIEADDGDDLVIADDRHGDLALQQIAHGAVEASGCCSSSTLAMILGCLVKAT